MAKDSFEDLGFEETFDDLGFQPEGQPAPSAQPIEGADKALALAQTAASGATLGFGDELAGLIGAGMQGVISPVVSGETASKEDLLAAYRDVRDFARKRAGQLREESPIAATAADLGGSLATGGALLKATKLLPGAQTLSTAASKLPAEALLTKISKGAALGLPVGAAAGAGTSEADLTQGDISGLAADTGTGAALGAGIGGAIPLATAPVKGAKDFLSKTQIVKDLVDSAKLAYKGLPVTGEEGMISAQRGLEDLAEETRKKLVAKGADLSAAKREVLEQYEQTGAKLDTLDAVEMLKEKINTPGAVEESERGFFKRKFLKNLPKEAEEVEEEFGAKDFWAEIEKQVLSKEPSEKISKKKFIKTPLQLDQDIRDVWKDIESQERRGNTKAASILKDYWAQLKDKQNELSPEIKDLNTEITKNLDVSKGISKLDYTETPKSSEETKNWLRKITDYYKDYTLDPAQTKREIDQLATTGIALPTAEGVEQKIGGSLQQSIPEYSDEFLKKIQEGSRHFQLASGASQPFHTVMRITPTNPNPIRAAVDIAPKVTAKFGEMAGKSLRENQEFLRQAVNKLSSMTPDSLRNMAGSFSRGTSSTTQEFGKILQSASEQPLQSRQAIIFSLMQQPAFRQAVQEEAPDEFGFQETPEEK